MHTQYGLGKPPTRLHIDASADRGVDVGEDMLGAAFVEETGELGNPERWGVDVREAQLHTALFELVAELEEVHGAGDVELVGRVEVEHDGVECVTHRADCLIDSILDALRVGVEQRCLGLDDQHARDWSGVWMPGERDVRAGDVTILAKDRYPGPAKAGENQNDGDHNADDEPGKHAQHDYTGQRG